MKINTATQLCAVIGNPVAHSLSPLIHNAAFKAMNLNYVYVAFQVENIADCMAGMRALPSFRGMSVTIPHKIAVMQYLDVIDPLAEQVGCVNTIINDNGKLSGTITDGLGTLRAFADAGVSIDGRSVLFLGSGGAVRAVAFAFAAHTEADRITILGRTPERVDRLVSDLQGVAGEKVAGGHLEEDMEAAVSSHDIIIHGTPIGMHGGDISATCVPRALLQKKHVVFDMVYRPMKTQLLKDAENAGASVIYGLDMLVNQAALQFEAWTGEPAPAATMRQILVDVLEADGTTGMDMEG